MGLGRQRLVVCAIALAAFALTQGPTIAALVAAPAGAPPPLVGLFDGPDQLTYFSFIQQARQHPAIFLDNRFTSVATQPLLLPYWAILGVASRWLNIPVVAVYIGAIGLLGLALLLAVRLFAERAAGRGSGLLGVAMVAAAGGVGWVGARLGASDPATALAMQAYFPDWFYAPLTWLGEMSLSSHFFAVALLTLGVFFMILRKPSIATVAGVFLLAASLGLLHPYSIFLVLGTSLAVPGLGFAFSRRTSWAEWLAPAAAGLGACTAGLYYWLSLKQSQGLASWYSQNILPSPHPVGLLLAYLPVLPLVGLGVRELWRCRAEAASRLMLTWALLPLVLAYVPVLYQRRFLDSYYIPVGLAAAIGWQRWRAQRGTKALAVSAVAILLAMTPLLRAGINIEKLAHWNLQEAALSSDEAAAVRWVGERCEPGQVVLADRRYARLWVPFLASPCSTDAAHHHLSKNFQQRYAAASAFFSASTTDPAPSWAEFSSPATRYLIVSNSGWVAPLFLRSPEQSFGSVRVFMIGG